MGEVDNAVAGTGLGGMDMESIGAMLKDMDPEAIGEMMAEYMKDPQVQEMVSSATDLGKCNLILYTFKYCLLCSCTLYIKSTKECKVPWKN
jgi:hypothetical protein